MRDRYLLHYAPDNASLIIRIAMDVAGVPFETALVDRASRAQESAAYRKINPLGMIPALETPQEVIFETGAILLWLADRYPGLLPAPQDDLRGAALKWLFFVSNSLHAGLRQMFYPEKFIASEAAPALRGGLSQRIRADFAQLDELCTKGTLLGTGTAPALDIYIACLYRWAALYPKDYDQGWATLEKYPNVLRTVTELERRPAVARAALAEGLGPQPFSNPQLPNPPEGSAT